MKIGGAKEIHEADLEESDISKVFEESEAKIRERIREQENDFIARLAAAITEPIIKVLEQIDMHIKNGGSNNDTEGIADDEAHERQGTARDV